MILSVILPAGVCACGFDVPPFRFGVGLRPRERFQYTLVFTYAAANVPTYLCRLRLAPPRVRLFPLGVGLSIMISLSSLLTLKRLDSRVVVKLSTCADSMDSWTDLLSVSRIS